MLGLLQRATVRIIAAILGILLMALTFLIWETSVVAIPESISKQVAWLSAFPKEALPIVVLGVLSTVLILIAIGLEKIELPAKRVYGWLHSSARQIEERRRAEDAYQAYENEVLQLISDPGGPLLDSPPEDPRRLVVWQRTRTVLRRLPPDQKRNVLELLSTQGLILARNLDAVVTLNGADFSSAHLAGIYLRNAHLVQANLKNADLSDATLCVFTMLSETVAQAELMDALPSNLAHPTGSNLTDAKLGGAILKRAILAGCDFSFADLEGADLDRADLRGADLEHARNLTQEQVNQAYGSLGHVLIEDTRLPEGLEPPEPWSRFIDEQKRGRGEP